MTVSEQQDWRYQSPPPSCRVHNCVNAARRDSCRRPPSKLAQVHPAPLILGDGPETGGRIQAEVIASVLWWRWRWGGGPWPADYLAEAERCAAEAGQTREEAAVRHAGGDPAAGA
jgi:hypothetical protein